MIITPQKVSKKNGKTTHI